MIGVALKGLLGRKLRTVLTALAIVLGVAMISGTYILTDTITSAFTSISTGCKGCFLANASRFAVSSDPRSAASLINVTIRAR